jgi:hypothetical protein
MRLTDQTLRWQGFGSEARGLWEGSRWESRCRLRIYQHDGKHIVVFTQSRDDDGTWSNPGTSITNSSENIATLVVNQHLATGRSDFIPRTVTFIEHYETGHYGGKDIIEETFDQVEYDWGQTRQGWVARTPPRWKHLGREAAEQLAGEPL